MNLKPRRRSAPGILVVVLALALAFGSGLCLASDAPDKAVTSTFAVEGMSCGGCEAAVQVKVKKLDGVRSVEASHKEGRAVVTYDPQQVTPAKIVAAIADLGYKAKLLDTRPASGK